MRKKSEGGKTGLQPGRTQENVVPTFVKVRHFSAFWYSTWTLACFWSFQWKSQKKCSSIILIIASFVVFIHSVHPFLFQPCITVEVALAVVCSKCKRTPKSFDLVKIRVKSLNLGKLPASTGKNGAQVLRFQKNGAQRVQNLLHEDLFGGHPKNGRHEKIFVHEVVQKSGKFGQKSFAPPKICLLLHLCSLTFVNTVNSLIQAVFTRRNFENTIFLRSDFLRNLHSIAVMSTTNTMLHQNHISPR